MKKILDMTKSGIQIKIFKALTNQNRIEILKYLHNGPSCVTLAAMQLHLPQANLSKHLQILLNAGLINKTKKGKQHCYFICRPSIIAPLLTMMENKHNYIPCSKPEQHL